MLRSIRPVRAAAAVAAALVVVVAVPAGASAKALPDLAVSAKVPAAMVKPGKRVTVTVTLRNDGGAKAGATTTRISLGASSKAYTKGDKVLATVRQKAVGKGGKVTAKVTIKVPASASAAASGKTKAQAARTILACADSGRRVRESSEGDNCVRVARVDGKAAGTVDGTGAKQAAAAPAKPVVTAPTYTPPPKWDNDPAKHCADKIGAQVPQDKDLASWDSKLVTSADARFWWPKSRPDLEADATRLAAALKDDIYPALTKLMGHKPMSDGEVLCAHGPDGKLDIYLVDIIDRPYDQPGPDGKGGAMGSTQPYTCRKGFGGNPSYMYLARRDKETLAHEFFHVLQNTFGYKKDCKIDGWLAEGTAEWAVEYVYRHSLMDETASAWLKDYEPSLIAQDTDYKAWTFWYSVAKNAGTAAIAGIFPLLADKTEIEAADAAIGTFRTRWPQFARDAYNRDVVNDTFKTAGWTLTSYHVTDSSAMQILLSSETTRDVPIAGSQSLAPLTRKYDIDTFNDRVRNITIEGLPDDPDYRLRALLTMANGATKEVDLKNGDSWCRDKPEQNVAEMVLVSSNASPVNPGGGPAHLKLDSQCDLPRYKVLSASFENHTTGTMTAQYCPVVGGKEDYGGQLAAPVSDPDFKLERQYDGDLDAGLFFDVSLSGSKSYDGCKDPNKQECHMAGLPYNPYYDKTQMGVRLGVDHVLPGKARLEWFVHEASIGVIDYGDDNCNVYEFRNQVALEQRLVDIPLDDIMRGTHTYTISHNSTWDTDLQTGKPATLKMNWTYTITIQVIDKDGNPIP
ncbi:MAG TPA: CARDB domain-containing protein [Baekduia sp.]|nr:CARDB domain-containing protein [Baekduia sp.]